MHRQALHGMRATVHRKFQDTPDGFARADVAGVQELQDLVDQLEQLPAPDGFRRITHLLVDAGARDFTCVNPLPGDIIRTPPAIGFTVATAKFQGQVTVLYERGLDLYAVELRREGDLVERVDTLCFDSLGDTLERLIDDGSWRRIQVVTLSGRTPTRH